MTDVKNPDPLLNRKEAARYLNASHLTLRNWATTKRHDLKFIKIGRSVRYRRSELDRFIDRSLTVMQSDQTS